MLSMLPYYQLLTIYSLNKKKTIHSYHDSEVARTSGPMLHGYQKKRHGSGFTLKVTETDTGSFNVT